MKRELTTRQTRPADIMARSRNGAGAIAQRGLLKGFPKSLCLPLLTLHGRRAGYRSERKATSTHGIPGNAEGICAAKV